ncbi:hypothetical protein D3C80_2031650 [compost metagenome]
MIRLSLRRCQAAAENHGRHGSRSAVMDQQGQRMDGGNDGRTPPPMIAPTAAPSVSMSEMPAFMGTIEGNA